MNSLNDSREFFDLVTATSSELSHVPRQLSSVPSPRGMLIGVLAQQRDTRNSHLAYPETFLLPACTE